jgi:DNA-binding MarR family transcriptional regulator
MNQLITLENEPTKTYGLVDDRKNQNLVKIVNCYYTYYSNQKLNSIFLKTWARSDYQFLLITRVIDKSIFNEDNLPNMETIFLRTNTFQKNTAIKNLNESIIYVKKFCEKNQKSVILLDRIDFLVVTSSFNRFMESLYQITEIVSETNSILLVLINPENMDKKQISIIQSELRPLLYDSLYETNHHNIDDKTYEVMKYLLLSKENHLQVNLKKIKREIDLTYPTVSKKIKQLHEMGLINVKKKGREKSLYLTKSGENLLNCMITIPK